MPLDFLDCTDEVTAQVPNVDPRRAWLASDLNESDWLIELDQKALEEINRLADFFLSNPLGDLQRRSDDFELPHCRQVIARLKSGWKT